MNETAYRETEERLLVDAGLDAHEARIPLDRLGGQARVLVAGEGDPVLFLTGGPDAGASWAYAAAKVSGVRALLLDRPGTGLSDPPQEVPRVETLAEYVSDLTADVLDAMEVDRAVLVGCSLGGYSALRSAAALPDRVQGVYLAGCPAFVPGWSAPRFFTMLRTPVIGRLMLGLPATRQSTRLSLRELGHRRSLASGRIPRPLLEWVHAWQRHTDTMRNDAAMICGLGTWLGGFDPALDLDEETLASVDAPCHVLVGTDDPVGGEDVAERLASLLPDAAVEVWKDAGHLPWYDDPARFATSLERFRAARVSDRL
ncbi:MAG: alpha/beta hydrolase [Aeromicrobium sp.]